MLLTQPNKFTVANRTIKNNHLFLVDTMYGEILEGNDAGLGLYDLDTRFLSCLEIRLNNSNPVSLLSSTELGYFSTLVYTNGQIEAEDDTGNLCIVPEETIQLKRETVLNGTMLERFTLSSYNVEPVKIKVAVRYAADFRDIFEIRHLVPFMERDLQPPRLEGENTLVFAYQTDTKQMETRIIFKDFTPKIVKPSTIIFEALLYAREKKEFNIEIQTVHKSKQHQHGSSSSFLEVLEQIQQDNDLWRNSVTTFCSDNADFNEMMERSHKDLKMLMTQSEKGQFAAAGIPWYVTLFGRDSIITARQCLIFNPAIAKWTLSILAQYQGKDYNTWRDEEPGKILHELRTGELAERGEIPHTPYYGSVDATPLWIILLYDYFQWTHDMVTLQMLWPNALMAMAWIDNNLKKNALGYATYKTTCPIGIVHQGWKDSNNSAMYENGLQAEPPIALVEVQGYVYLAKKRMAALADVLGHKDLKHQLKRECKEFRKNFNRDFWMSDYGFYAMGLDSQGRQLKVVSSNPGHCLETGLFTIAHARKVMTRLMAPDMFSGWGIRTLSSQTMAYNPMSYHNGSVWPHDNAIIAKGFCTLERPDYVEKIFSGLYEAARLTSYKRLPELFCGFTRDESKTDPPVRYPVACSPQAWAAGAVYALIQSMLSLKPDLANGVLKIEQPLLPAWMNFLEVRQLRVGQAQVDLVFRRADNTVVVDVLNRSGKLDILVKV